MNGLPWTIAIAAAYLMGSIPFALLISLTKGIDLRKHGSGNIGATNCGRVLGRRYGLLCFLLDAAKGFVPVVASGAGFGLVGHRDLDTAHAWLWIAVAAAAVFGHVFPVWLGFRGGKGVATGFGAMLGIWPFLALPALAALLTWVIFATTLRYIGLAGVVAAASLPGYFMLIAHAAAWPLESVWPFVVITSIMAVLVPVRHVGNLQRIARGTEPRVGGG